MTCPVCGGPVALGSRGRPRVYCSVPCRRTAERRRAVEVGRARWAHDPYNADWFEADLMAAVANAERVRRERREAVRARLGLPEVAA